MANFFSDKQRKSLLILNRSCNGLLDHGVFRELRDVHYFNRVDVLFGAVTWPNEQDIAPETLLAEMLPLESTNPPNESLKRGAPDAGHGEVCG
jgi:hypothetical protein